MLRLQLHLFSHSFVEAEVSWVSSHRGKWVVTSSKHWQIHNLTNTHNCFNRSDQIFFFFLQHEVPNKHLCWQWHMEGSSCFWHTLRTNLLNAHLLSLVQTTEICSCQTIRNPTQWSVAQSIPHHSRKTLSFSSSGWCNRFYQVFLPLKEEINAKYINVLLLP